MDFKIDFEQNPLTIDFATLVNDQFGPYKVYKPSRDQLCNRTHFFTRLRNHCFVYVNYCLNVGMLLDTMLV